jgi:hypothetical protein
VGQHCGFIYALCRVGEYIASGSGDSTIKAWMAARRSAREHLYAAPRCTIALF